MAKDRVFDMHKHGRSYRIVTPRGKIRACYAAGTPYERSLLEHIYATHKTGTFVDCGANIGNHTLWFAKICQRPVVAFEPVTEARLVQNVVLNDVEDMVTIHVCALGAAPGVAHHVSRGRLQVGELSAPEEEVGKIDVVRMDSFHLQDVSMIKLDIEGMEPAAIRGAENTIRGQRPTLYVETWNKLVDRELASILEPWGYKRAGRFKHSRGSQLMQEWSPAWV